MSDSFSCPVGQHSVETTCHNARYGELVCRETCVADAPAPEPQVPVTDNTTATQKPKALTPDEVVRQETFDRQLRRLESGFGAFK